MAVPKPQKLDRDGSVQARQVIKGLYTRNPIPTSFCFFTID